MKSAWIIKETSSQLCFDPTTKSYVWHPVNVVTYHIGPFPTERKANAYIAEQTREYLADGAKYSAVVCLLHAPSK